MRVVMVGASQLGVATAELLVRRGHEVVVIDSDRDRIEALVDTLDCAFIHGDGSKPAILREADPARSAYLLCLTHEDQTNILASLVGRSLGFARVITKIEDPELSTICAELGLEDTIIPDQTTARMLADMTSGQSILELSTMIRNQVRFFSFVVSEEVAGTKLSAIDLPQRTAPVVVYRDDDVVIGEADVTLARGDEVLLVTHREALDGLRKRWAMGGDQKDKE